MRFLSNFGCKITFMPSVNFGHQHDSNSLFKGSIGHVTYQCKWPIILFHQKSPIFCSPHHEPHQLSLNLSAASQKAIQFHKPSSGYNIEMGTVQKLLFVLLNVGALPFLRWCYTRRFATRIFSSTQRCNVVATLFRIVTTMFQLCNPVLRYKSIVVVNRPV